MKKQLLLLAICAGITFGILSPIIPEAGTVTSRLEGLTGEVAIKAPVRVATTTNITLSAVQTIDGIAVIAEDRVLVKDQTTTTENGIYIVKSSGWLRAKDFNGNRDTTQGTLVLVVEGTSNAGVIYQLDIDDLVFDTDNITFTAQQTFASPMLVVTGGTGVTTLTDGGVLLGSGTVAVTAMAVLADGEIIVGDGTTDPVAESGATARTSLGVGTGDSPTFTGVTTSGFLYVSITDTITAGTTQTQAGATAMTTAINRITVSAVNGDGVKLPTAVAGMTVMVINSDSTQTIKIWPNTSDDIDDGSTDAVDANTLAAGGSRTYVAIDATSWYTQN